MSFLDSGSEYFWELINPAEPWMSAGAIPYEKRKIRREMPVRNAGLAAEVRNRLRPRLRS
jgi:hypothetical protein